MATNETQPGLNAFGDPSKLNFFGASDQDQQEYQNALMQSLNALEERYSKPNYWKIAAAFAKPQLGGFMASLGSANEVMGENLEQQRASQLPIAQLRAQLAMSKIGMGQNKAVAEQYKLWKDSGEKPEDLMTLRDFALATAPNAPVTQAIAKHYESLNTERQLASSEQGNALQRIQTALALHKQPNPADLALVESGSQTIKKSPVKPTPATTGVNKTIPTDVNTSNAPAVNLPTATENNAPTPAAGSGLKVNLQGMPDVSSLYNNPDISNPKVEAKRAAALTDSYKKSMQSYYDAANRNDPQATKAAGDSMTAAATELQKMGLQPPVIGKPTGELGKPVQTTPQNAAPVAQTKKEDTGPYPILNPMPTSSMFENMPPDIAAGKLATMQANAKSQEEFSKNYVASLAPYANPTLYNPLVQSLNKTEKLLSGNKAAADKVQDALGNGTVWSQITKSIQKGGTVNFAGGLLSGSVGINLPAETWVMAGLPRELAEYANQLATEYAKQSIIKAKMGGVNFSQLPVTEFSAMLSANPNMHLRADASLSLIRVDRLDAQYQNKLHHTIQDEYHTKIDKDNEATPYTSVIRHSNRYKNLLKAWDYEKNQAAEEDLKRSLKP